MHRPTSYFAFVALSLMVAQPALAQPSDAELEESEESYEEGDVPPPPAYTQPYGYGEQPQGGLGEVYAPPGAYTHDGFYFRALIGPGYTSFSTKVDGDELSASGGGMGLSIAGGLTIAPDLILYLEFLVSSAVDPEVRFAGFSGTVQGSANVIGFGVGAAYYLPFNFYLSGTLATAQIQIQDADGITVGESDFGFGVNLTAGQEWWVSENWGLGVALNTFIGTMQDRNEGRGDVPTWTAFAINAMFTATYN